MSEQIVEGRPVLVFAVDDQRRRLPFEALPDWFNRVKMRRANWKKHQIDPEFVGTLARVLADV